LYKFEKSSSHMHALPGKQVYTGILRSSIILIVLCSATLNAFSQPWIEHGRIVVLKQDAHYLAYEDSSRFFWFGDTAWELFHRASREEALQYLENRKQKGFNVIQAVAISEFHKQKSSNYYGDSLFMEDDPGMPLQTAGNDYTDSKAYDYWDHVQYIVQVAREKNLYMAILPSWGEWVTPREHQALFDSPAKAYGYGWFLANLLKQYPNVIWILGGDRHPDERKEGLAIWQAMAEGIADATNSVTAFDGKADYSSTLMSYHSYQSSSTWFHKDPWIDFHMWGSYHSDFYLPRSYEQVRIDRSLPNPKPTINAEPSYEDHPVNYGIANNGVFTDVDVRNAAYWTFFAGAAGYTYGAHPIWQFADSTRPAYSTLTFRQWQQALDLPGAGQIRHIRQLMESKANGPMVPQQDMIVEGQGVGANYVSAIRGERVAMIYIPTGAKVTIKLLVTQGKTIKASWFDPRTGEITVIGSYSNTESRSFTPPGVSKSLGWLRSGRGCDWVLLVEVDA
jgi:hypothetical protein